MPKRIKYEQGEKLGPYGVIYWKDAPNKNGRRQAEFICPFCEKHFINIITRIKNGSCRSCGCQQGKPKITYQLNFQKGDLVGPNKHIFIKEIEKKNNMRYGLFKCSFCNSLFENSLSKINTGAIKSCGCQQRKIKDITGQRFGKLVAIEPTDKRMIDHNVIWKCQCDCGNIIEASQNNLTHFRTTSCGCKTISLGEEKIFSILQDNNINFKIQYVFKNCINPKTNTKLRFDFYLPDYNCCIEYDGIQHFEETTMCSDSLIDRQYRDNIKNQYCKDNDIKLIRIPYFDFNLIDKEYILNKIRSVL